MGNQTIANYHVKKGELLIPIDQGDLIHVHEMSDDYYALQVSQTHFIGTKEPDFSDPTCFLNHSCEPNLVFKDGELVLTNIVDIYEGDELTWDYSTSIDDGKFAMDCQCKSPNCRKTIRSFGELDLSIKKSLLPVSLKYIQEKYLDL